jgi:glycosyltransferase involved in cell wall biosynthesis
MSASSAVLSMQQEQLTTASRRLGVLVVDEELPFPLTTGKRIRTYNLLKSLASRHQITLLCHRNIFDSECQAAVERFRQLCIKVEFLARSLPKQTMLTSKPRLAALLGMNFFSKYPYLVQKHVSNELCKRVAQLSNRQDIDLVHIEWTPYAAAITKHVRKPWVIDAHNVESLIWKRYFQTQTSVLKRLYVWYQWKKLHRFEQTMFQQASEVVLVSELDKQTANQEFGPGRRTVVDNGVDLEEYPYVGLKDRDVKRILFVGSLDWRPNVDAMEFFLDEIWPQVRTIRPELQLDIVGRYPTRSFAERVGRERNATLHRDVPRVQPFLDRAGLLIVPLRIGGGSRLKILEAAANGLPVISTEIGAEGIEMEPGRHYIQANSAEEFKAAILENVRNQSYLERLALSARRLVESQYDWSILSHKLDSVWHSAVARASRN